jgi:hypothetical protein
MKKDLAKWNLSSSVLKNSPKQYSIPKDLRFKQPHISYHNNLQLQYKSTLEQRVTKFGYGDKF